MSPVAQAQQIWASHEEHVLHGKSFAGVLAHPQALHLDVLVIQVAGESGGHFLANSRHARPQNPSDGTGSSRNHMNPCSRLVIHKHAGTGIARQVS